MRLRIKLLLLLAVVKQRQNAKIYNYLLKLAPYFLLLASPLVTRKNITWSI